MMTVGQDKPIKHYTVYFRRTRKGEKQLPLNMKDLCMLCGYSEDQAERSVKRMKDIEREVEKEMEEDNGKIGTKKDRLVYAGHPVKQVGQANPLDLTN